MSSFIKNVINYFCSTWEYKAILIYIFLGSFFITCQNAGLNYSELLSSSFTNKIFLTVILYPSFVAMFMLTYQYISKNYSLLLRLKTRKKYATFCIVTIIIMTIFLFLQAFIIELINCNLTPHSDFKITNNLNYSVNDFIIFIISVIKILLTAIVIGFFNLFLQLKFNNKNVTVIILMACLTLIFFGDKFYPSGFWLIDFFNPGFQSHGYYLLNNTTELIVSGIVYFSVIISLLIYLINRSSKKCKIGVN